MDHESLPYDGVLESAQSDPDSLPGGKQDHEDKLEQNERTGTQESVYNEDNEEEKTNGMEFDSELLNSDEFWENEFESAPPLQSTPLKPRMNPSNEDKSSSKDSLDLSRTYDGQSDASTLNDSSLSTVENRGKTVADLSVGESGDGKTMHNSSLDYSRMSSHTSMDYDYEWDTQKVLKEIKETTEESSNNRRDRIILHELSFEEGGRVAGPELYAPVFLAVTEDNDDEELASMRKTHKTQSLEDLLEVLKDEDREVPKRHSKTPPPRLTRGTNLTPPIEEQDEDEKNQSTENNNADGNSSSIEEDQNTQFPMGRRPRKLPQIPIEVNVMTEEKPAEPELEISANDQNTTVNTEPDEEESIIIQRSTDQVEQEGTLEASVAVLEDEESRVGRWYTVVVNSRNKVLDLDKIEPYMKVLSHGGYCNDGRSVIVTFMACYLPDRNIRDYEYIMEQLFFYVVSTVDLLATREDYVMVYFNGGARKSAPGLNWLRRYYTQVDKSLKKSLDSLYIVHPDLWLKTMVRLFKPFISSSFSQRLHMVKTVRDLSEHIPTEYIFIPDEVICTDPDYLRYHSGK